MILFYAKKLSEDFLFRWVDKVGLSVALLSLVSLIWLWIGYFRDVAQDRERMEEAAAPQLAGSFPGEVIGQGPLRLRPVHTARWVARVAEELTLLAYNSRPDRGMQDAQVILQLKEGKEQIALANGGILYLQEEAGKGLKVAEEGACLWVKPIVLDETSALLEMGRKLADGTIEKGEFITSFQGIGKKAARAGIEGVSAFRSGTVFMQDLVIQKYGGSEFASWNQKLVLDLQSELGSYCLRLSPGDYLMYEEGEWKVVGVQELEPGKQIAKVLFAADKGLEIEVWDEQGFSPFCIKIDAQKPQNPTFGPEWTPSAARFRTPSQVSCLLGKRRMIVRQGDWLIRASSGWRHLRSVEELQLYLDRRVKGDLFVCEAIERDALGKGTIKGTLFDETRTYMQPVQAPVTSDKPFQKSSRKRRIR